MAKIMQGFEEMMKKVNPFIESQKNTKNKVNVQIIV
jgi:hypothetical protein